MLVWASRGMDCSIGLYSTVSFVGFNIRHILFILGTVMAALNTLIRNIILRKVSADTLHWLTQRLSSAALIPLTILFVFTFVNHIELGYEENSNIYKHPVRALFTFLFVSLTLLHFRQGAEVVIDDYIRDKRIHAIMLKTNSVIFWVMNSVIFVALVKIVADQNWS